jgi:hypothetical protein
MILYPNSAPYAQAIAFACQRYGILAIGIQTITKESIKRRSDQTSHRSDSPRIEILTDSTNIPTNANPDDLAVCILSQRLVALNVSPGGKIASLLERRLQTLNDTYRYPIAYSTWIQASDKPPKALSAFQKRLSTLGGVLWFPAELRTLSNGPWRCENRIAPATLQPVGPISAKLAHSEDYLIHTTRTRQVHWPDQSDRDLLDEAFQLHWNPDPRPLDSLLRIARTQRLFATKNHKRGSLSTISFTSNSLIDLTKMRTYQPHLARWDWEPYGIAIRADHLRMLGCESVRYLPNQEIDPLSPSDQAFCQPLPMRPGDRDWTYEKEWRLAGDLRLARLPEQGVFYFVSEPAEAKTLAHYTRWPVYWMRGSIS